MNNKKLFIAFFLIVNCLTVWAAPLANAKFFSYAKNNTVIGSIKTYTVKNDESLIEIARKFNLGYDEIVSANPEFDPFVPGNGVSVIIPTSWILPDAADNGIVINLSEMRLYYFFKKRNKKLVMTFPIGIGSEGNDTPTGIFSVIEKIKKPKWNVPKSIKKEKPQLPDIMPPGPDNPLGSHALRLSARSYLIHGTNRPWGVGRRASHGCIRLYPEDIPKLFRSVPNGIKVVIVKQPIKAGIKNNRVFIEVHKDDYNKKTNYSNMAVQLLWKKTLIKGIVTKKLHQAVAEKRGIPVEISE